LHDSAKVGVEELMAHARERLGVRAPRRIIVVDALPRSATGKILKHELIGLIVSDK
jgi:acyl-coenzyme A synthetase/AMP-(fatty) acid ligase